MKDFAMAALPWSCMGVAIAVALTVLNREKGRREAAETKEEKAAAEKHSRNLVTGICIGECLGISIAQAAGFPLALGITAGMLLGVLGGSLKR